MVYKSKGKRLTTYVPDYVVFDLETTGINVNKDNIIEISAVKVKNQEVVDTFSTLINPQRSIPYGATAVNGITDKMVADAPVIHEVMDEFLGFTESQILVGHNIHTFDLKFIYQAADLFGAAVVNDYIDTLYMARTCLPQLKKYKLVDISAHFNISSEGAHRAMNDCIMNQRCFEEMGKIQGTMKLELCPRCGAELQQRSGKFGRFWGCSGYPDCRYTRNV